MSKEERLRQVGFKIVKFTHMRYGPDCDPSTKINLISQELGVPFNVVESAIISINNIEPEVLQLE